MFTHLDFFNGVPGADLSARQPTAGGPITPNPGTTPGSIAYHIANGAFAINNSQGTYQYAAKLPNPNFTITWQVAYDPSDNGTDLGLVISTSSAFTNYLEVSWSQVTQHLTLDLDGTATTYTTTFASAQTITFQLHVQTYTSGARQVDLFLNGTNVLSASNWTITGDKYIFLRMHGPTSGGSGSVIKFLSATDLVAPPSLATAFLNPTLGVFCQYTPATPSSLSACRFEYAARAIILKDTIADVAAEWLMENTPAALVYAP